MKRPRATIVAVAVLLSVAMVLLAVGLTRGGETAGVRAPAVAIESAISEARPAAAPFEGWRVVSLAVGGRCLSLVLARTTAERRTGLTGRTDLGPYDGMVFVTPADTNDAWTMAGTHIPLDLALYDRDGRPLERHDLVPCDATAVDRCPVTVPAHRYRLAVEAPRGSLPSSALAGCAPG